MDGQGRIFVTLFVSAMFAALPVPGYSCSLIGCVVKNGKQGPEMAAHFSVSVRSGSKPIGGATVLVTREGENEFAAKFSGSTGADGRVRFSLPPGNYGLAADLFGIGLGGVNCFHVSAWPSLAAKRFVALTWDEDTAPLAHVAGRVMDFQPGTGEGPIWNLIHSHDVPIEAARLTLRDPETATEFQTVTDHDGTYSFGAIPDGMYILHIEGGIGRDYDPADLSIRVSSNATASSLPLLRRMEDGCYHISLRLVTTGK
jgi:hypothetical protein